MKKNYFYGILGALLGGLVATIPWILMYVYANMIYSLLAVFIAMGAFKGYELLGGKIDKKLPIIIIIVSFISVSIAVLLIIPCIIIVQNGRVLSINNLQFYYSNSEFLHALMKDYVISLLFTALGISTVIASIKKQINTSETDKVKIDLTNGNNKKDIGEIKKLFLERNATAKETAITIKDLKYNENTLNILLANKVIVKNDDKYYFDQEKEKKYKKRTSILSIIGIIFFIIILALCITEGTDSNREKPNNVQGESISTINKKDITFKVPTYYKEYEMGDEENGWYYVLSKDLTGYSGFIDVYYFDSDSVYSEEWSTYIKQAFESEEYGATVINEKHYRTKNRLEVAYYEAKFDEYTDHVYYIFGEGKMCIIEVFDYNKFNDLIKDGNDIVESLSWNK